MRCEIAAAAFDAAANTFSTGIALNVVATYGTVSAARTSRSASSTGSTEIGDPGLLRVVAAHGLAGRCSTVPGRALEGEERSDPHVEAEVVGLSTCAMIRTRPSSITPRLQDCRSPSHPRHVAWPASRRR